tara:strand:+ start:12311 stop:13135 length:825 start_codon:yes stop_codon:yes gene_type:complete
MLGLGVGIPKLVYPAPAGYVNSQSLDLDGTGDFVDTNYSVADLQVLQRASFSISMWVRAPYNASFTLFGHSDTGNLLSGSFQLDFIYVNGAFQYLSATGKSSNSAWGAITLINNAAFASGNANNWVHVVLTVAKGVDDSTNGTQTLYLNGSSVGTGATKTKDFHEATVVTSGHNGLAFGADMNASSATGHMTGQIDEIGIWSVALDADAVTAIYNSGAPFDLTEDNGNYDNSNRLNRYYRFEGSSQADISTDRGLNGVDVSLEGNPTASSETPS